MNGDCTEDTATRIERNRERRLRRHARRQGFSLCRRRGTVNNWCGPNYLLVEDNNNTAVLCGEGGTGNNVTLDDVEAYLDKAEQAAKNFDWDKALGMR
jgi:hypothetical protein